MRRYGAALLLAALAQLVRLPLAAPTSIARITYVPFMVVAATAGLGPGLLATAVCTLKCMYFATEPLHSFAIRDPDDWESVALLAFTGLVIAILFDRLKRIQRTEAKTARALSSAYAELEAIHANAPVALLLIDESMRIRKINECAVALTGRNKEDLLGCRTGDALGCLEAATAPEGCGHAVSCPECAIRRSVLDTMSTGTSHHNVEFCLSQPHRRCFLISTTAVQANGKGRTLVCALDITARKQAEEALRHLVCCLQAALEEKTVLLQEIHHRVKNNLAVISSLLSLKADATPSWEAREALQESQRRVRSIALIHEHLYCTDHFDRVNFADYAQRVAAELCAAFEGESQRIAVRLETEPIELDIGRAVPCALILNELVSNSFKHAFPAGRAGEIRVAFREYEPDRLELIVEDDGAGAPQCLAEAQTNSLGLRIIRILTTQLDGALEQQLTPGTRFVLRFPK